MTETAFSRRLQDRGFERKKEKFGNKYVRLALAMQPADAGPED